MIPSVSIKPDTSVHVSHDDYQVSLLTADRVIQESQIKHDGLCSFRYKGRRSWFENENVASLNGRVNFINKVTSRIIESMPLRDKPITFISLGSAGLLTESFINEQLKNAGYKDISWRIIEVDYQSNGYEQCRKEFREHVNANVRAFTTEQAYLNKSHNHGMLAENDKNRGGVVILSIDPPTDLEKKSYDSDCMILKGRPVEDVKKANAIYFIFAPIVHKEMFCQVPQELSKGDKLVGLDCALKCSINKHGKPEFSYSQSEKGKYIYNGVKRLLDLHYENPDLAQRKIELSDVAEAFDKFIEIINIAGMTGIRFFVSDYDTSKLNLHNYFTNCNNETLFASFENNDISFERKE
ncbi:hypothetical protein J5069_02965 [Candidatus Symbiopectobacterium sp. NZEC127]|uniref:hypothetical protein n=1 Tax=Candidatus Symbiopectobacterium sp. NZEC127 TaxID=2820472 RepID=UPI002227260E|nr:hypothetical protein [Candidatus Symbiopectobacterium sp. NZEC127]MCW2484852.1 hypothetical protein [Candidatus Symbiopectobacterium sp. NZEC127]